MIGKRAGVLGVAVVLAVAGLCIGAAPAGGGAVASGGPPPAKLSDLKVMLMDGSILTGKLSVSEFSVDTKYGTLKVPVEQIQMMMPGLASHPSFQQEVNGYITDLGAEAFSDREKAQQALMKIGPDIRGELERQAKSADQEKLMRLQKILEDFDNQNGDEDAVKSAGWVKEDVIVTPGFTVVGHITTSSFSINSSYGVLNVKLEDVRQASREAPGPEEIRKNISISGTAFAQRTFSNSNIKLAKGDQVFVTATGTLQMTPWGGNQQSTPDGASNFGTIQSGGGAPIYGGTLIGKIGDGGPFIKLGSKATFTADRAGTLQLGIASQGEYSSYTFPGEYQVKIRVVKKN